MPRCPQRLHSSRLRVEQSRGQLALLMLMLLALVCGAFPAAASTAAPDSFAIDIQATAGGTISPDGGIVMVAAGANITFTFAADECHDMTELEVDGIQIGPVATYTFTNVQSDHLIYATFQGRPYTITASSQNGGLILPSGPTQVLCGDNLHFEIQGACLLVQDVLVDGVSIGAVAGYTFTNVRANHTIEALFTAVTPTFTLTARPSPLRCDTPDTLTAQITSATGGTIGFLDNNALLGTVPVTGGIARLVISPPLLPGTHPLRLVYSGGQCAETIVTPPTDFVVPATTGDSALVTLTVNPNPAAGGTTLAYTLNLSILGAAAPWLSGQVQFYDNGVSVGTQLLMGGTTTFYGAPTTVGTHVISARFLGAGCVPASWSNSVSLSVIQAPTSLLLNPGPNPSAFGQQLVVIVDLLANSGLASRAGGTLTIREGATVLAVAIVTNGHGVFQTTGLPIGQHVLSFEYSGDPLFGPSQSSYTQFVNAIASPVTITPSANPTIGLHVTLTARVPDVAATGTMTFSDINGVFAVVPIANGFAIANYVSSAFGTRALTAQYSGDPTHSPGTAAINQQFLGNSTAVFFNSTPNPSLVNRPVTLTASVSPSIATGTVTFRDNTLLLQTVPLVGNTAVMTFTPTTTGVHPLTATYNGDTLHSPSSAAMSQTVAVKLPTTVVLSSSQNPGIAGRTITLSAAVAPVGASGSVEFLNNGTLFGTAPVVAGVATIPYVVQAAGEARLLTASYLGDSIYAVSTGQLTQQSLNRLPSTTTLTSSENPGLPGRVVTFTAHVSPLAATGAVRFYDNGILFATLPLSSSAAATTLTLSALGTRNISVIYEGDSTYAISSAVLSQVTVAKLTSTLSVTSSANPDTGRTVTLTFLVTPAAATGTITVKQNGAALATLIPVNGVARFGYHVTAFGSYAISATFASGDNTYFGSSATLQQVFLARPTLTRLTSIPSQAVLDVPVTLNASVTPAPLGGLISFFDGPTLLGTAPMVSGVATFQTVFAVLGEHPLTATFPGDTTYSGSGGTLFLLVPGVPSTTALTSTAALIYPGTWVAFTARVAPNPFFGTVVFTIDGTPQPAVTLTGDVATFSTNSLPLGNHAIYARFGGGTGIDASTSNTVNLNVIEYSSATLHVRAPNGGENMLVGSTMNILWETLGGLPASRVSIYISRTLSPPVWESIAENVPNTGSYLWTSTGPSTNQGNTIRNTALIGVFELSGNSGSDDSDLGFSLVDLVTGTELTQLDAEAAEDGVRLSWASANGAAFTQLALQRAPAQTGPWQELALPRRDEGGRTSAFDLTAEPGWTYWYRLIGTTQAGAQTIMGPVSAQSGATLTFALGVPRPNPARSAVTISFTVARTANVRLSVLDLQGREVATLADGVYSAGRYEAHWKGSLRDGQTAPTGLYFLRYTTPDRVVNQRVTLVR